MPVIHNTPPGTRVITAITVTIPSHGAGAVEGGEDIIGVTTAEGEAGEEEDTGLIIMEAMGMGEDITMGTEGGTNNVMIRLCPCVSDKFTSLSEKSFSVHDLKDSSSW